MDSTNGLLEGKRIGDKFYRASRDVLQADHNAALNVLARLDDSEITRFTPHKEVRPVLLLRSPAQLSVKEGLELGGKPPQPSADKSYAQTYATFYSNGIRRIIPNNAARHLPIYRLVGVTCLSNGIMFDAAISQPISGQGRERTGAAFLVARRLASGDSVLGDVFYATDCFLGIGQHEDCAVHPPCRPTLPARRIPALDRRSSLRHRKSGVGLSPEEANAGASCNRHPCACREAAYTLELNILFNSRNLTYRL